VSHALVPPSIERVGALQPGHLIVILVIVLIVFGPGKLGDLTSQLGRGVREFRESTDGRGNAPASVPRFCSACGAEAVTGASFCDGCGRALA
jgi:sec-independent protein translocase protein TatA